MSCAFDLDHYRELLEAARPAATLGALRLRAGGGDLFLRHDVDLSLEAALAMARLEHELGAHATYFLMRESVFYNLDSALGRDSIAELRDLGHAVCAARDLPARRQGRALRCRRRLAQPRPGVRARAGERLRQRHAGAVVHEGQVPLRLEPALAARLPARGAARRRVRWLQLLIHPEIWVYPGETMRETMHAMLEAKRESCSATSPATGSILG